MRFEIQIWRVYILLCVLPGMAALLGVFLMPESPRFLLEVSSSDAGSKHRTLLCFTSAHHCNVALLPSIQCTGVKWPHQAVTGHVTGSAAQGSVAAQQNPEICVCVFPRMLELKKHWTA